MVVHISMSTPVLNSAFNRSIAGLVAALKKSIQTEVLTRYTANVMAPRLLVLKGLPVWGQRSEADGS